MNLATGSLILLGLLMMVSGVAFKLAGISLLAPHVTTTTGYFTAANTCLLMAIIADRFQKN